MDTTEKAVPLHSVLAARSRAGLSGRASCDRLCISDLSTGRRYDGEEVALELSGPGGFALGVYDGFDASPAAPASELAATMMHEALSAPPAPRRFWSVAKRMLRAMRSINSAALARAAGERLLEYATTAASGVAIT